MEKKYQIFISSTYEDLKSERLKVQETILSMHHFPIGMEMFSADNEDQWKTIQETIDSSDYYIVIIGHRYGSLIEKGKNKGISYTQKEFMYAHQRNIPILAFIIDDKAPVLPEKMESDAVQLEKLKQFKRIAKDGRIVEWWMNADDLAKKVAISLNKAFLKYDRPGWISNLENAVQIDHQTNMLSTVKEYDNLFSAYDDIVSDIKYGSLFDFMGLQGSNFLKDVNALAIALKEKDKIRIRFLVHNPFSEDIRKRLECLPTISSEDAFEDKWRMVYKTVIDLTQECKIEYNHADSVEIRYYDNQPLTFRLLFTEKHLYMTYYENQKLSRDCSVYRFENDSPTYITYQNFFNSMWVKAQRSLPQKRIPAKYSFLQNKFFPVTPSLVVNISSGCDMDCLYCPRDDSGKRIGGENLLQIKSTDYCSIQPIKTLVKEYCKQVLEDKEKPVLRITGGEPFYGPENRKRTLEVLSSAENFSRIVICSNGVSFELAYNENEKLFEKLKRRILLKISLDSLNEETFSKLTKTKNGTLAKVKSSILFAGKKKFNIELNVVATRFNLSNLNDILDVFEFAKSNGLIGIKILTINDFGGNVSYEQSAEDYEYITARLNELIKILLSRGYEERSVFLYDNKGIRMRRFVCYYVDSSGEKDKECTITIVDHHNTSLSITPRRTFSKFCLNCKYYPENAKNNSTVNACATGVMSLTLRADGLFSPCRLLTDTENSVNISNLGVTSIRSSLKRFFKEYDECWHES